MLDLLRRYGPLSVGIVAMAIATWPYPTLTPGITGDANWAAALAFVAEHRLPFGDQLVWTYGPLGFMTQSPLLYYGDLAAIAVAFQAVVQLLLVATIFLALRRSFPLVVAIVVTLLVPGFIVDRVLALGFAWCLLAVVRRNPERDRLVACFPFAIGVVAGILVLGKLNHGVEITLLAIVALSAMRGRRRMDFAVFAGALAATAAIGWFATGQSPADVWPYLRYGKEAISGYAAAMGTDNPYVGWNDYAAALLTGLAIACVWSATSGFELRRRVGVWLLCAMYAYLNYKAAFVRRDGGHTVLFIGDLLILFLVLPASREHRSLSLASVALSLVMFAAAFGSLDLTSAINPRLHIRAAVAEARLLASSRRRGDARASLAQSIRDTFAVPPQLLALLDGHTVASWPYENGSLAYAYDWEWRLPPVLEPYAAYTPALDRLDAEMLASARAPERILWSTQPPIDGRLAAFEAPEATVEILCRYGATAGSGQWQVLSRGSNRCGAPRQLATVEARWGAPVTVPSPRSRQVLVTVRIDGTAPYGLERVRAILLRPSVRNIVLDGKGYRLISATASDGLLLQAPRDADWPKPFTVAPDAKVISVQRVDGNPDRTLRYTFEEIPIRPAARRA